MLSSTNALLIKFTIPCQCKLVANKFALTGKSQTSGFRDVSSRCILCGVCFFWKFSKTSPFAEKPKGAKALNEADNACRFLKRREPRPERLHEDQPGPKSLRRGFCQRKFDIQIQTESFIDLPSGLENVEGHWKTFVFT